MDREQIIFESLWEEGLEKWTPCTYKGERVTFAYALVDLWTNVVATDTTQTALLVTDENDYYLWEASRMTLSLVHTLLWSEDVAPYLRAQEQARMVAEQKAAEQAEQDRVEAFNQFKREKLAQGAITFHLVKYWDTPWSLFFVTAGTSHYLARSIDTMNMGHILASMYKSGHFAEEDVRRILTDMGQGPSEYTTTITYTVTPVLETV